MPTTTVTYDTSRIQQLIWRLPEDAATVAHVAADDHTVEYQGRGFAPDKTVHRYEVNCETYRSFCVERVSLAVYEVTYSTDPGWECEHKTHSLIELIRATIRRKTSG